MLSTQVSQMVLSAHLTVLQLITTVWAITSEISYLREFSAQKRQIVLSAHLTVLRIITTVWAKTSKISYLREFKAQVSQSKCTNISVLSSYDRFTAYYNCMSYKVQKSHISVWVHKYHKWCSQLIWPFYSSLTTYYNCMSYNFRNLISPRVQCTKTTNRLSAHLTVLRIITTVWAKISKISYLREFSAQVSQIVYSAQLTVLTAYYNCMRKKFKNFITPYVNYTSITNRFLSSFDRFTVFTTVRGKTSKISLIRDFSAQSLTNRVLSSFDRFTASYNCMRKNFKKSPISVS